MSNRELKINFLTKRGPTHVRFEADRVRGDISQLTELGMIPDGPPSVLSWMRDWENTAVYIPDRDYVVTLAFDDEEEYGDLIFSNSLAFGYVELSEILKLEIKEK